jgi:lipoate-protein ligase B
MRSEGRIIWLGRREYTQVWQLQQALAAQRHAGVIPDTLLLLEHPPTITLGRKADPRHLLASPEELTRQGIAIIESDRGGDVTYHGPGQLVGYPIFDLNAAPGPPDLHRYLRNLEEALARLLAAFGVEAGRFPPHTGVWVGLETPRPEKIAAIGIKASRWVTQHGFALNVQPEMAHFDLIVPCGLREYGVTSLAAALGRPVEVEELLAPTATAFADVFDRHFRWAEPPNE